MDRVAQERDCHGEGVHRRRGDVAQRLVEHLVRGRRVDAQRSDVRLLQPCHAGVRMRDEIGEPLAIAANVAPQPVMERLVGRACALIQHIAHALLRLVSVLASVALELGHDGGKALRKAAAHHTRRHLRVVAERSVLRRVRACDE